MNRAHRRAAKARSTLEACTPENLAKAAVVADQAGQPGVAELMREVRRGGLALFFSSDRKQTVTVAELNQAALPTVVVVGDDDYSSSGPAGWRCSAALAEWAAAAVIHAAGATAGTYAEAAKAARLLGRAVLIETDTAHAAAWAEVFQGRPVLIVAPTTGPHPILPPREKLN
jgi:beta-phosphoglucomutase-like phosphatase (HAD superfamily)